MNFNTCGLKATMTAAVVAGTMAIGSMSAQAAIVGGSTLSVTGNAKLVNANVAVGGNSTLDFLQGGDTLTSILFQENTSTDSFGPAGLAGIASGAIGTYVDTKDLTLKKTSADHWELQGPVADFIRRGTGASGYAYNLDSFILEKVTLLGNVFYLASSTGSFFDYTDGTSIGAGGPFSSQTNKFVLSGTSISGDITADNTVPTPALLPGLIGLGMTAMRKKRQAAAIAV
jgi:hypothetical protein